MQIENRFAENSLEDKSEILNTKTIITNNADCNINTYEAFIYEEEEYSDEVSDTNFLTPEDYDCIDFFLNISFDNNEYSLSSPSTSFDYLKSTLTVHEVQEIISCHLYISPASLAVFIKKLWENLLNVRADTEISNRSLREKNYHGILIWDPGILLYTFSFLVCYKYRLAATKGAQQDMLNRLIIQYNEVDKESYDQSFAETGENINNLQASYMVVREELANERCLVEMSNYEITRSIQTERNTNMERYEKLVSIEDKLVEMRYSIRRIPKGMENDEDSEVDIESKKKKNTKHKVFDNDRNLYGRRQYMSLRLNIFVAEFITNTYSDVTNNEPARMIWDPGSEYINYDEGFVASLLKLKFPELQSSVASVCTGAIVVSSSRRLKLPNVLFDTGALHGSYISKDLIDRYRQNVKSRIRKVSGEVVLGDSSTRVKVNERISLPMEFVDWKGKIYTGMVDFCVWSMPGLDAIIGLPDILLHFLGFLVDMLEASRNEQQCVDFKAVFSLEERYQDLIRPWTVEHDPEAPEEAESYVPCDFTGPLYYLSKPHEEVLEEYRNTFEEHVAEDWRKKTKVLELLNSEKARGVFCPAEWKGINGFEPLELQFKPDMPEVYKPAVRPINPRLYEDASKEFKRMEGYMYTDSDSPIASPLVIAPKATKPFIRICGDYVWVNRWLHVGHYYIPHVMKELEKAAGYKYFMDLDLTNSFHQIKLGPITSSKLSVVTPWGLRRPVYLPEGVAPASGTLQKMVMSLFDDFRDWTICIFDNILVLCNDYDDGMIKLEKIIDRCYERNVVMKFSKSWIGFQQVKFFGYKVTPGKYEMDEERKQAVAAAPFPNGPKAMQRFLGVAVFFNEFIPDFATVTGHLYDMIKPTFKWEPATWTIDYQSEYEKVKEALTGSVAKYFPDYSLDWILRVDASKIAVCAVLLQIIIVNNKEVYHPIGFKSMKLSGSATNWDAHKREAYGCYWGVKVFSYYLHGKKFILETDHANLLYMEKSEVYIVVRWRIYLQSFMFLLRHISGKKNIVADWGTRMYALTNAENNGELLNPDSTVEIIDCDNMLKQVHGGRMFHYGPRKTWQLLGKYFPGHKVPFRKVVEYCLECIRCQKDKKVWVKDIQPIVRTVIPDGFRARLGIDTLTITPADEDDNCLAIVIVNLKTKHVMIYPAKGYDADTAAAAIFVYITRYGLFDEIISDPGSSE